MPTPFAHTVRTSTRPGLPLPARSVAFLHAPTYTAQQVVGVPAFIGPIIRAVVWYGNRAFSTMAPLFNAETRLGRTFINLFGPFSVPVQTSKTIALDTVAEIITHAFGHWVAHDFVEWAKHKAVQYYRAYEQRQADGNVSVVFIPDNDQRIDLLKWDP